MTKQEMYERLDEIEYQLACRDQPEQVQEDLSYEHERLEEVLKNEAK